MKLKYDFVTRKIGSQIVAVPVGEEVSRFNGMIKLNGSGEFIFNMLKEETDKGKIISEFLKAYDATVEQATETVTDFIDILVKAGVVE